MTDLSLFATVPRGLESLLAGELRGLGAAHVKQVRAGVAFSGSLETAYRACLWSRLAGRVLLPVTSGKAADGDELYKTAQGVDWSRHLDVDATLAVDFTGVQRKDQGHALRRGAHQGRDRRPVPRHVRRQAAVGRRARTRRARERAPGRHARGDLRRPQRPEPAPARLPRRQGAGRGAAQGEPGRRTAAATRPGRARPPPAPACSTRSAGPARCRSRRRSWRPTSPPACCAPRRRPSRARRRPSGSCTGTGTTPQLWAALLLEARERRGAGIKRLAAARPGVTIRGSDRDQRAVKVARDFVKRAGLHGLVTIDHAQLETVEAPAERGLLATNAPYGERLDVADTEAVYRQLGERLREAFPRVERRRPRRRPAAAQGHRPRAEARDGPEERPARVHARVLRAGRGSHRRGRAAHRPRGGALVLTQGRAAPETATRLPCAFGRGAGIRPAHSGRAAGPHRSAQIARRRRRVPRQPAAQEPAPAGPPAAARGHHLLPPLRRRPARVQPRRRRVRRVGPRAGVRGAARDRPRQGEAKARRGGRGHRRRPRDAAGARGAQGAPPPAGSGAVRAPSAARRAPAHRRRRARLPGRPRHLPGHRLLHRPAAHAPAGPPPRRRPPLPQPLRLHRHHDGERPRRRVAGVHDRGPLGALPDVGRAEPHGQRLRGRERDLVARPDEARHRRRGQGGRTVRRRAPRAERKARPRRTRSSRPTASAGSPRRAASST